MDSKIESQNKMGSMPINKLLISMSLPIIISMFVQALYNFVDSIFVSRICEDAITAVSLAFPIQMLVISVGVGIGVGMSANLSKYLGEKDYKSADLSAQHGYFLSLVAYAIVAILGGFLSRPFFEAQTDIPEIVDMATDYLFVCTVYSFGLFFAITGERVLQSTGKTVLSMYSQMSGAIINIALDPVFIFGFMGIPAFGVKGAAIATVIGQIAGMFISFALNKHFNKQIDLTFKGFKPNGHIIKKILAIGIPSICVQAVGSVMTICMNSILLSFTSTATAVFGIYFKLQSLFFMPVMGLNNGMVPIIAYNYGAKNKDRITKTIKLGSMYAVGIMLIALIVFMTIPDKLLLMFNASDNMLDIGCTALRTISLSYIFAGFCIVCISVFQALGHGLISLVVSFCRQIVVLLPVAYLFSIWFGLDAVWWSFPIAEIASVTCSLIFLLRIYNKTIKPLGNNTNC